MNNGTTPNNVVILAMNQNPCVQGTPQQLVNGWLFPQFSPNIVRVRFDPSPYVKYIETPEKLYWDVLQCLVLSWISSYFGRGFKMIYPPEINGNSHLFIDFSHSKWLSSIYVQCKCLPEANVWKTGLLNLGTFNSDKTSTASTNSRQ